MTKLAVELRDRNVRAEDAISEFKDELKHVLYHVRDSGIFAELLDFD